MEKINAQLLTDNNDIFIYIDNKIFKVQLRTSNAEHITFNDKEISNMKDYTGDINKFIIIDGINKLYLTDKKEKPPKEGSITEQISDFINSDTTEASITKLYKRFKDTTGLSCSYTLFYRIYQKIKN